MTSAFDRIKADPQLAAARKKLSAHEIMTIIRHVWAADEARGMTETTIYVNGHPHRWEAAKISHENICWLCGEPDYASVTWRATIRGGTISGITTKGREIAVYPDMRIDCVVTGNG